MLATMRAALEERRPRRIGVVRSGRTVLLRPEAASAVGALLVFVGFAVTTSQFLTLATAASVGNVVAELGLLGVGVTLLMISGNFDLSIGAVIGVSSYAVVALAEHGMPAGLAIVVALLISVSAGLINGLVVVKTGLHSFIVTLGTMMVYRGLLTAWTGGFPRSVEVPSGVQSVFAGTLPGEFRTSLLWFLGVVGVASIVLLRTRIGNWTYASGQNPEGARNLGVPVRKITVGLFIVCSLTGGLVGVIQAARFGSSDALRGEGDELLAIAVAVIGGALLTGGYGTAIGALFGALVFGMVQVGLVLAGAPGYYYTTFVGLLLVGAVLVNTAVVRRLSGQRVEPEDPEQPPPTVPASSRLEPEEVAQ